MYEGLTGVGNVRHQLGRRLEIPIRVRDAGVSHIGREGKRMATDRLTSVRTTFKGAHGKGMPQIHQP